MIQLSIAYPIRLSLQCEKAWIYLQKHKVRCAGLLRIGGESAIINKANEFYLKEKRTKLYGNYPDWLFDTK